VDGRVGKRVGQGGDFAPTAREVDALLAGTQTILANTGLGLRKPLCIHYVSIDNILEEQKVKLIEAQ
jgi:hypothetical protein